MTSRPLPAPQPGKPSRYRPAKVRQTDAWVPTLTWGDADAREAELVSGPVSNIRRALTLVPDEARSFFESELKAHGAPCRMKAFIPWCTGEVGPTNERDT